MMWESHSHVSNVDDCSTERLLMAVADNPLQLELLRIAFFFRVSASCRIDQGAQEVKHECHKRKMIADRDTRDRRIDD